MKLSRPNYRWRKFHFLSITHTHALASVNVYVCVIGFKNILYVHPRSHLKWTSCGKYGSVDRYRSFRLVDSRRQYLRAIGRARRSAISILSRARIQSVYKERVFLLLPSVLFLPLTWAQSISIYRSITIVCVIYWCAQPTHVSHTSMMTCQFKVNALHGPL